MKKAYTMVLLVEVEAESFLEAEEKVMAFTLKDEQGKEVEKSLPNVEHDNYDQRVIYLHPEEDPGWAE